MNSFFICATQPSNVGDLIINKMLIDELCRYGKVFVDAYGIPDHFRSILLRNANTIDVNQTYGCTTKRPSFTNLIKLTKLIRQQHIKQLTQSPGPLAKYPTKTKWGFTLIYTLFKKLGASVRCYGNCCSTVATNNIPLDQLKVDKYYLRSYTSVQYAQKFYGDRCFYIPDLAFLLYFHRHKAAHKASNIIAFNVRIGNDTEHLIKQSLNLIQQIVTQGYQVVLYYQAASDAAITAELYRRCSSPNVSLQDGIIWYDDLDFYTDKQFVISNRLHALLTGAAFGAIPIGFTEQNAIQSKIGDIFHSLQWPATNLIALDTTLPNIDLNNCMFDIAQAFQCNAEVCRATIEQSIAEITQHKTTKHI